MCCYKINGEGKSQNDKYKTQKHKTQKCYVIIYL